MAGPQVQHSQRPNSAYYTGLNGSGSGSGGGGGGGGSSAGMATSASHTGLHALRQVSNETELIYRGSHSNGTVNELSHHQLLMGRLPSQQQQQQQPQPQHQPHPSHQHHQHHQQQQVSSIAGTGSSATDALINTITSGGSGAGGSGTGASGSGAGSTALGLKKSSTQRSIEIIVDASQCGKEVALGSNLDVEDVEQGGGGQESSSSHRKSSRHRHRPLHRRLLSYVRNLFQGSTTQNDSELEEFETPARYRPDSLSALSRATRFTEDEIKRIYRGFKAECPTGVVKEDTFKVIYSQFFPQGANPTLYAHYVFNTLDQDHSGIVSFEDFVQGLSILSRGSVEEKLRWTFSLYDINGDGFITREEMTDIVTAIYELMGRLPDDCPEEEKIKGKVEHIFQKMDINRDGVVTLEEFLEACRNDDAISRSMSYTVRRRRRSRSQQQQPQQSQQQQARMQHQEQHHKDSDKRKSNHKTKNRQQQKQQHQQQQQQPQQHQPHQHQQQQPHSTRAQSSTVAKCCHIIDMDGDSTTTSTTTSAATGTTLNCNLLNRTPEEADEYEDEEEDDDDDGEDDDEDEEEELEGDLGMCEFVCRHCQRPQSLGQHHQHRSTRRSQSKSNSRRRSKSKKRQHSSQRVKGQQQHQHQQQQLQQMQRWPEINAANEQAIRFRCPQVGPQVGRDLHAPQPMHFHHPQSQGKIKSKTRPRKSAEKRRPVAGGISQSPRAAVPVAPAAAPPPPPLTLPAASASALPPPPPLPSLAAPELTPLPPLSVNVAETETEAEQLLPTTPDSPSLVTVSTWYTVAKQGVSC
ncbi:hypothetical protein KR009_000367 [Drosophila setifemur]|nr:hypothetical protein KR009_000367 [Drosophila setifemur]